MSKTYNPVTGKFVDDAPDSNITNPADPKTGDVLAHDNIEIVGPPIEGHPGRYARGKDFMSEQIQLGVRTTHAGKSVICKSEGSIYDAYWEEETD